MVSKNSIVKEIIIPIIIIAVVAIPSGAFSYGYVLYKQDFKEASTLYKDQKYDEAYTLLQGVDGSFYSKLSSKKISTMKKDIEEYNKSKEELSKAEELYKGQKYLEALEAYKNVSKKYKSLYDMAQERTSKCKEEYINTSMEASKKEAANGKYEEAIALLEEIVKIDDKHTEAMNLKDLYGRELSMAKEKEEVKKAEEVKTPSSSTSKPNTGNTSGVDKTKVTYPKVVNKDGMIQIIENEAQDKGSSTVKGFTVSFAPDSFKLSSKPTAFYYRVVTGGDGPRNISYSITIKYNGETKTDKYTSGDQTRWFQPKAAVKKGVKGTAEVTFTYKGKNYKFTKTFTT